MSAQSADELPTTKSVVAVIVNPVKADVEALKLHSSAHAEAAGLAEPLWIETTEEDPGLGMAEEAIKAGATLVIAAGGDGTVRAVAQGLRGSKIPLGLIPSGTGNLLARNLDLPLSDVEAAVRVAYSGQDRAIDLCEAIVTREDGSVSEKVFTVMAGLGIDAEIMANTNSKLKATIGWLAYVDAGMRALPKSKPFKVRYRLHGRHSHDVHISTILVGNCGKIQGGLDLLPEAKIDDGKLDVAVLQPKGLFGWVRVWSKIRWENSKLKRTSIGRSIMKNTSRPGADIVSYLRSSGITLRLAEPRLMELDGDDIGKIMNVSIETDPGSLTVRVPVKE